MTRPTAHERGYNSRWNKARAGYLRKHPLCADCSKRGLVTLATVVDHIEPHKRDVAKFWDSDNWQPLCASCHSRKTSREDGGFGNKASSRPSKECGLDGIPTDNRHHWRK